MNKMLFAAAALSLVLAAPASFAQGSDQGAPNSQHGSGDMMQDGPHASAAPEPSSSLPSGLTRAERVKACDTKWQEAVSNGTTADRSERDFKAECMRAS